MEKDMHIFTIFTTAARVQHLP